MKQLYPCLAALMLAFFTHGSHAQNVSVSVGQPGFYGRIDLGGYPAPQLIYSQPMYAHAPAYGAAPMYLHAPPGHVKHWHKHCHRYGACGAPVYFVQERWYQRVYVPEYRHHHRHHHHGHHHRRRHDN